MVSFLFPIFLTCYRSVLVEAPEFSVVHASVHIVYTRTFCSLLWINTSGELYRLPYKTASSNGVCWKIPSIVSVNVWSDFRMVHQSTFFTWSLHATVSYIYVPCCGNTTTWVHISSLSTFRIVVSFVTDVTSSRKLCSLLPIFRCFSPVDGYQFNLDAVYYVVKLRRNEM